MNLRLNKQRDLELNSANTFSVLRGKDAVLQNVECYARTLRGEMIHRMRSGIRFFESALGVTPMLAVFEREFRDRVLQVPGVVGIQRFEASALNGELQYNAIILTADGPGEVSSDGI